MVAFNFQFTKLVSFICKSGKISYEFLIPVNGLMRLVIVPDMCFDCIDKCKIFLKYIKNVLSPGEMVSLSRNLDASKRLRAPALNYTWLNGSPAFWKPLKPPKFCKY